MGYEWIPAAVAAAGSAVAGFAGQHPSKARRYAKEMALYNTQLSEEMYNKYESPAAQMRQYQEAGLNPNLIYGQQLNGPSAGSAEFDGSSMLPDEGKAVAGLANAITAYQEIRSRQIANSNAQIAGELQGQKVLNEQKKGTAMDIQNQILADTADYQVESAALKVGSQQFAHAYNWKVKMQKGLNDLEQQKEALVGQRHKNKKTLKEIDAIDVSMGMMRKQMEVADKQMDQITQNMEIQSERRPWELKSIQTGIGYQRQMTANAATQGKIYQKDFDWYDDMAQNKFDKDYYNGPNVWSLPGLFLKTVHKAYDSFAKRNNLP